MRNQRQGIFCVAGLMVGIVLINNLGLFHLSITSRGHTTLEESSVVRASSSGSRPETARLSNVTGVLASRSESKLPHLSTLLANDTDAVRRCTQEERLDHLRRVCDEQNGIYTLKETYDIMYFYVIEELKVAACIPPKAATTTLKTMLVKLMINLTGGRVTWPKDDLIIHDLKYLLKLGITVEKYNETKFKDYFRFMTAREPFGKLASGRKDKLTTRIEDKKEYKYVNMKNQIIESIRGGYNSSQNPNVTMQELIEFIFSNKTYSNDDHWNGYADRCNPCLVNYDVIIKMETFDEDIKLILHKIPVREVPDLNKSGVKPSNPYFNNLTLDYETVSKEWLQKLSQKFIFEQALFGYRFDINSYQSSCLLKASDGGLCC